MDGFLHPLDKGGAPINTYHIDHLGPLPTTKKSYCRILTVIDAFTKFVWLYATKTTSTSEVIDKLLRQSAVFGNPRRIISDRGTAFRSGEFEKYCNEEEIEHSMIATGVPRGNGQVERLNRIVIPVLTKLSAPIPGDWHKHLDKAQQFINHVAARSTGLSPFTLLFGTRMRLREDPKISEVLKAE